LLAQAADLVLDVMGAPDIILRSLVAILALGFIPAVIFAWVFEMTPEGIKKEKEVDRTQSITQHTAKKLDIVTIILVVAAIALLALDRFLPAANDPPAAGNPVADVAPAGSENPARHAGTPAGKEHSENDSSSSSQKSIAVLPFANRSNQNDDLFFTDGIHDDLLTQLAKVGGLTVISRTSVMEYRDTNKNLKQIGAELNVNTILEGGVQKVGNRVRVTAQLIEVATDNHLWAESFDRELTAENIFELQSEIARKIVSAISVQMTPEEERLLSEIPTQNLAAYEAYLKAREVFYGANYARSQEDAALPWLERAIALDPDYIQALALLSSIYGQHYWRGIDTSEELLAKYRNTLDRAMALKPDSPEALRALANYHYRVENNYQQSLDLLEQALEKAPGNVDLYGDIGFSLRRLGRWDESIASLRKATELDPANLFYQALLVETMANKFDYQGVIDNTVPLEDAAPETLDLQLSRASAQFQLTGDLGPMERVLETLPPVASTGYLNASTTIPWYRRDADRVIEILRNPLWKEVEDSVDFNISRLYRLANAYRLKGDNERANETYQQIVDQKDNILASALQPQAYQGMNVAISLARLGRIDEALALANQLVRDIPEERDAMLWGSTLADQAMVIGLAGDAEGAIDLLSRSMELPAAFPTTAWDLYYEPNWDFLRDNPRFVELATPANQIQTRSP
jgi:TolB-like protein/Flp pilus assembly protein TadD